MKKDNKYGFSLMEVNMAVLLIAIGLLTLFALFPAGLRESNAGIADTQEAMFADAILSRLEGAAQTVTNWSAWDDEDTFKNKLKEHLPDGIDITDVMKEVEYPENTDHRMRYTLRIKRISDTKPGDDPEVGQQYYYPERYRAMLKVMYGMYGDFSRQGVTYYTEFLYTGM